MIAFIDFEASSLAKESYPLEVAWVFENGRSRSCLIKPISSWIDWSEDAQRVHGISREMLAADGAPVDVVANEMLRVLADHDLYAKARRI